MNAGKTGGEFILQSADFIECSTSVEDVNAFVETALAYADY